MHNENYREQELIRRMQRGDRDAMKEAYLRYARYLTAVCSRYIVNPEDVRDILQDSFVKIFGSIGTFKPLDNASLKSWMTRIVVNDSLKFLRRSEKMQFLESVDEYSELPDDPPPTEGVPYEEMRSMIGNLPAGYRSVFNLYVFEQKNHKEIAKLLGISENTSASQFHKAKKLLAAKIKQYKNENPDG